jgi:hypothetical protein
MDSISLSTSRRCFMVLLTAHGVEIVEVDKIDKSLMERDLL